MTDPRISKLARVIVRYSTDVRKGDLVQIVGSPLATPLAVEIYREVLAAGGNPWVRLVPDECQEILLREGGDAQVSYCGPLDRAPMQHANVLIRIWSDQNTKALSGVDPARQALLSKARRETL